MLVFPLMNQISSATTAGKFIFLVVRIGKLFPLREKRNFSPIKDIAGIPVRVFPSIPWRSIFLHKFK